MQQSRAKPLNPFSSGDSELCNKAGVSCLAIYTSIVSSYSLAWVYAYKHGVVEVAMTEGEGLT